MAIGHGSARWLLVMGVRENLGGGSMMAAQAVRGLMETVLGSESLRDGLAVCGSSKCGG